MFEDDHLDNGPALMLTAICHSCRRIFMADPDKVPSTRLPDGSQVVFCRSCVEAANPVRRKNGLPEITILPGTYF